MQDRYAGDIGDFGKFGMLRALAAEGLSVGINWYRVETPAQELSINDGMKLIPEKLAVCDPKLADALHTISLSNMRSIRLLEKADLVPDACYYAESVPVRDRATWHSGALSALAGADLVFLDPDNGLLVKSVGKRSAKAPKYAFYEEMADYVARGQSVIVYNHRSRKRPEIYFGEIHCGLLEAAPQACAITAITFPRGSVRDYIAVCASREHENVILSAFMALVRGTWGEANMCRLQPLPIRPRDDTD